MWSSMMAPQGHSFLPAKQQQQREFGMLFGTLPIGTGKSFKNPNFVNNFNKYQSSVKPVDSSTKNYQNSCHSHIIDSIKERCPEIIPSVDDTETIPEPIPTSPVMCLENNKTKSMKREHMQRKKRQMGKHSKQNQKRQEIKEMLQEDMYDSLSNSTDICSSPRIHILHLQDYILQKPSPNICSPSKTMVQSIEIPLSKAEMVLTITKAASPCRSRQYSATDSDDSFILFDHEGNEEQLKDDINTIQKESLCNRLRKPSLCESEDSFILFEHGDTVSQADNESDYCFESSDEETDEESDCHSDWHDEGNFDETDSSFSMVQSKKVRFASDQKLCEVHPMIQWSYAYQAARKGPWETYARDRCRFRERALRVEREIKHVFEPQHRERVYRERFASL